MKKFKLKKNVFIKTPTSISICDSAYNSIKTLSITLFNNTKVETHLIKHIFHMIRGDLYKKVCIKKL